MHNLNYELKELCKRNCDGSYATQKKRREVLDALAHELTKTLGYRRMLARSLKEHHVKALADHWLNKGLATNTIKARMSYLRWWAKKVGKHNLISPKNTDYGIGRRINIPTESKACDVTNAQLEKIQDEFVKAGLRLAREFGLRKSEAVMFMPKLADKGDHIALKACWCKGGKARTIPILTSSQRDALDYAKVIAGSGSLIPAALRFHQQRNRYEKLSAKESLTKLHGLRHQYAQWRYEMLTGWPCPLAGGPMRKDLAAGKREIDTQARLIISKELGHERIQIVATYVG